MRKFYWNQETNHVLTARYAAEPAAMLEVKRGSIWPFALGLHAPGEDSLFEVPVAGDLRLAAKSAPGAAAAILAILSTPTPNDDGLYEFEALIDSSTLRSLLDFNETTEKKFVDLQAEFAWRPLANDDDDATAEWRATLPFILRVHNDIDRADDDAPLDLHYGSVRYLGTITGLTGGGATDLDSIPTTGLSVPYLVMLVRSDTAEHWLLRAGTTAEDGIGIVRPDDYHATTNAKIWIKVS